MTGRLPLPRAAQFAAFKLFQHTATHTDLPLGSLYKYLNINIPIRIFDKYHFSRIQNQIMSDSVRILFIRHGQRNNKIRRELPNNAHIPLTELGHKQAHITGVFLSDKLPASPISIYSSPFLRCLQTSEQITASLSPQQYHVHTWLSELIDGHDFDGTPLAPFLHHLANDSHSFAESFPRAQIDQSIAGPHRIPEWPESKVAFAARLRDLVSELHSKHANNQAEHPIVICVCHGFFMETLLDSVYAGSDYGRDPYVGNTCIADVVCTMPACSDELNKVHDQPIEALKLLLRQGPMGIGHSHLPSADLYSF
jgi:broad specificity phosphatase PhoE